MILRLNNSIKKAKTDRFGRIGLFSFLVINEFENPFSRLEAAVGDSKKQISIAPIGTRGVCIYSESQFKSLQR